jgi:hypothetical protein
MPSTVDFDMKDPDIKSLVDGWADNREYSVTMTVRTGSGKQRNKCEVLDVEEEGGAEESAPDEESDTEPTGSPGAKAVESAMGGMGGGMMTK